MWDPTPFPADQKHDHDCDRAEEPEDGDVEEEGV
jgi:hypothetical protein